MDSRGAGRDARPGTPEGARSLSLFHFVNSVFFCSQPHEAFPPVRHGGATGAAVETTVLAALTAAGVPLLAAKLQGTEAGILNNFCWNDRWTFRNERGDTGRALLLRQRPDFQPAGGDEGRAMREGPAHPAEAARGRQNWGGAATPPCREGTAGSPHPLPLPGEREGAGGGWGGFTSRRWAGRR